MIKELTLAQFKKHTLFKQNIEGKIVFINGNNATGKTSILEALSLFSPGSGIFNNDADDLISFGKDAFEIHINANFKASITYTQEKKEIKINDTTKKSLEMLEFMRIYGLTPYLALAFWKDSTIRRKHIDRLIMQNDPLYPTFCNQYAKAMKERNKLIELKKFNSRWEEMLHPIILENGIKITEIRTKILDKIAQKINSNDKLKEFLESTIEIKMSPTLEEQKEIFSKTLSESFNGPHKAKFDFIADGNFVMADNLKSRSFNYGSTGQQKKLLLALTIAALPDNDTTNILLLDDLFTTLDDININQLLNILLEQNFQTWITNTQPLPHEFSQNRLVQQICL